MKDNNLRALIKRFDHYVKGIDFAHLPKKKSEEYRDLVLKTADEQVFCDGRYTERTEMTLESFDNEEVIDALKDLSQFDALTKRERVKLSFYIDLKNVCYPLLKGEKVDWAQWPWYMESSEGRVENIDLCDYFTNGRYLNLTSAIAYELTAQALNSPDFFSSVARNEIANNYQYYVKELWLLKDERFREYKLECFLQHLVEIENHMHIGQQLGFDIIAQSIYDALDTCISKEYQWLKVEFAKELRQWLNDHWTMGDAHPTRKKVRELKIYFDKLLLKTRVISIITDPSFTWDILTMDVLEISMSQTELHYGIWEDND